MSFLYPRGMMTWVEDKHVLIVFFSCTDNPIVDRPPSACGYNQATCMNGECIDRTKICNGYHDCSDGSDENSCSNNRGVCEPNEFKCENKKCILKTWRCDGENDCGDGSDEANCAPAASGTACRFDEFQCRSGQCIPKAFQCDTTPDCADSSDEIGCSELTNEHFCDHPF